METRRTWKSWLLGLLLVGGVAVFAYFWKTGRFMSGSGGADAGSMPGMKMEGGEKPKPKADVKTQDMPGMPGMKADGAPSGSPTETSIFGPPEKKQLTGSRSVVSGYNPPTRM